MKCYRNAMLLSIINAVTSGGHKDGSLSLKIKVHCVNFNTIFRWVQLIKSLHITVLLKEGSLPLTAFIVVLAVAKIK